MDQILYAVLFLSTYFFQTSSKANFIEEVESITLQNDFDLILIYILDFQNVYLFHANVIFLSMHGQ